VGEAEVVEPKVPQSVEELRNLSTAELGLIVALGYSAQIRAVAEGDDALRLEAERWSLRHARRSPAPSPRSPDPPSGSDIYLTRCRERAIHRRCPATTDS